MVVGVPRERKTGEHRVALSPDAVGELCAGGHMVFVEAGAGSGAGFDDAVYSDRGARIVDRDAAWDAELVVKVKEPVGDEVERMRSSQVLFTYLHLAASRDLAERLCGSGVTAIGFETVEVDDGRLPLLAPMSEIAGRLAVQVSAALLTRPTGGVGILIGGAPGVEPARVVVLGGGVAGLNAASVAAGMGADVVVLEREPQRVRRLEQIMGPGVRVRFSDRAAVAAAILKADVVIGSVHIPGRRSPWLVSRNQLVDMRRGALVVDVAIDQGGCIETSHPTTHDDPTFVVEGVTHYCVANMPGAVPVTATHALSNALWPYVQLIADHGIDLARDLCSEIGRGINVERGEIVHPGVAESLNAA